MPSPNHAPPAQFSAEPRQTWRIPDDRRVPALEPLAEDVRRHPPVTIRETLWDSEDRVLQAEGVVLTRADDGQWSVDRGDGPEPVAADRERMAANDAPPRDAVEVFLRGRPLRSVLVRDTTTTLVTLRGRDGRVRAEVADVRVDDGHPDAALLRSSRWWALTDDGRDGSIARATERALSDAATEPGEDDGIVTSAPPAAPQRRAGRAKRPRVGTAASFVLHVLDALRADLVAVDPRVRTDEHEAVHDLRKVLRRLRSVLAVFRGALDRDATEDLRAALAETGRTAGVARDAEVLHAGLFRSAARAPEGYVDAATLDRIGDEVTGHRERAAAALRQALRSDDWFRTLDALDELLRRAPTGPHAEDDAVTFTTKRIERERARVDRVRDALGDDLESLHEVRKAARRLRYALLAAGDLPDVGKRRLGRLEAVQETLGDALDAAHAAAAYRRLAESAARDGADTFGYGALATAEHAWLERGLRRSRKVLRRL